MTPRKPLRRGVLAEWQDMVVLLAANSWSGVKLADQHMAECLSERVPVLYVDPPLSPLSPLRSRTSARALRSPGLRVLGPSLARLTPVVLPRPSRARMLPITQSLLRRQVAAAVRRLGTAQALVSAWPLYDMSGSCDERARVYWAQDDFVAGAPLMGLDPGLVAIRERSIATAADLVVSANPRVHEHWQRQVHRAQLIPYGADVRGLRDLDRVQPADEVTLPEPIALVVGHLNSRIDVRLLAAVADAGVSLLLVGPMRPGGDDGMTRLLERRNVQWVGPKPYSDLPRFLRTAKVGLVPYGDSGFNAGSFPLKTLEYLAAGLAVVSTPSPANSWLATDLIRTASGPGEFCAAVLAALHEQEGAAQRASRRSFAADHSYSARAEQLLEAIATLHADGRRAHRCDDHGAASTSEGDRRGLTDS